MGSKKERACRSRSKEGNKSKEMDKRNGINGSERGEWGARKEGQAEIAESKERKQKERKRRR
jgi:hypothetical protein